MALKDFLRHTVSHMADTVDRYSRDPRLSDERRSELRDKADLWRSTFLSNPDSDD